MDDTPDSYLTHLHLLRIRCAVFAPRNNWQPCVNVYRCHGGFHICIELAGVEKNSVEVQVHPRRILVRGHRQVCSTAECGGQPRNILAMEIDDGPFERELRLPEEIDADLTVARHREGMLIIDAPFRK